MLGGGAVVGGCGGGFRPRGGGVLVVHFNNRAAAGAGCFVGYGLDCFTNVGEGGFGGGYGMLPRIFQNPKPPERFWGACASSFRFRRENHDSSAVKGVLPVGSNGTNRATSDGAEKGKVGVQ